MKKILFGFALSLIFLISSHSSVFAVESTHYDPTDPMAASGGTQTNIQNARVIDGSMGVVSDPFAVSFTWNGFNSNLYPDGATDVILWVKITGASSAGAARILFQDPDLIGTDCYADVSFSSTNLDNVFAFNSGNCALLTDDRIKDGNYRIYLQGSNLTFTIDGLEYWAAYSVPVPSVSVSGSTASASAGLALLSLSGDTTYTSSVSACTINLFQRCSRSGYANDNSQTPVATILLDATDPRTTTSRVSGNTYYGAGYSPSSSEWTATNVEVPYQAGWSCDYPTTISCEDRPPCSSYVDDDGDTHNYCPPPISRVQSQGIAAGSGNYDSNLVASPSATVGTTPYLEPECSATDFICSIYSRFTKFVWDLFTPDASFNQVLVNSLQKDLAVRAPFAYVYPVFNLDLSNPGGSSGSAAISIPITVAGQAIPAFSLASNNETLGTLNTAFRSFFQVVLWLVFVLYLFGLSKRLTT